MKVLVALEAVEVGAIMLEHLSTLPPNERREFTRTKHFREDQLSEYQQDTRGLAARCRSEGWMWLLREGRIAPKPDDNYDNR